MKAISLTVACLVALPLMAAGDDAPQPMTNEPRDFLGIAWASPFDEQRNAMNLVRREGDVAYYKRNGDSPSFGRAEAIKIAYRYYKDQFSAGVVQTYGGDNKKALIETLHSRHGASTKPYQRIEQYRWAGNDMNIVLTCEVTSYCAAEFVSNAVSRVEQADTGSAEAPSSFERDDD